MKTAAEYLTILSARDKRQDSFAAFGRSIIVPLGILIRWRLSLAAAGAVLTGMVLQRPSFDFLLVLAVFAGFFGCAGCSALNQLQEQHLDAVMIRTQKRPLVVGTINTHGAVTIIRLLFILSGTLFYLVRNWPAVFTLLGIIVLYNGLYTFLKGRTTFFLLPGAVAGALPPVLGWLCSGGSVLNLKCLVLFALFFVWQIPHFWLFAERHKEDYAKVGIQFPWRYFSGNERKIQFLWICAFSAMLLLLPGFGMIHSIAGKSIVVCLTFFLIIVTFKQRIVKQYLFHVLNGAMFIALLILLFERITYITGS